MARLFKGTIGIAKIVRLRSLQFAQICADPKFIRKLANGITDSCSSKGDGYVEAILKLIEENQGEIENWFAENGRDLILIITEIGKELWKKWE